MEHISGTVVGVYQLDQSSYPDGLVYDGKYIWVAISTKSYVTRLLASTGEKMGNFPIGAVGCVGIEFDGKYMWVTNFDHDLIHKVVPGTGEVVASIETEPNSWPWAIPFDGVSLWVSSYALGGLTKY